MNEIQDDAIMQDATAHVELTEDGVNKIVEDMPDSEDPIFTEQDQKEYQQWISDPANKDKTQFLAGEIVEVMGDGWFTLNRFVKKSKLDKQIAFQKLFVCKLFGFLLEKQEKQKTGHKTWETLTMYKISIDNESKIKELDNAIAFYQGEIKKLELQKQRLQNV